jgi:outer membrane protein assembly factor BamB
MRVIISSISTLILCSSFLVTPAPAAPDEWYTYRHDSAHTGAQPYASELSDPAKVGTLEVRWGFPSTSNGVGEFKASPIVVDDTVFIGSVNGYFYGAGLGGIEQLGHLGRGQIVLGALGRTGSA